MNYQSLFSRQMFIEYVLNKCHSSSLIVIEETCTLINYSTLSENHYWLVTFVYVWKNVAKSRIYFLDFVTLYLFKIDLVVARENGQPIQMLSKQM